MSRVTAGLYTNLYTTYVGGQVQVQGKKYTNFLYKPAVTLDTTYFLLLIPCGDLKVVSFVNLFISLILLVSSFNSLLAINKLLLGGQKLVTKRVWSLTHSTTILYVLIASY